MRLAAILAFALAACTDPAEPIEPQVTSGVVRREVPLGLHRQFDLVFVIENAPAMAPHRERLRAQYRRFIDVLRSHEGGLPDLRIAVVTTDLGSGTAASAIPGCSPAGESGRFRGVLVDEWGVDGNRVRNYEGDLADAFVRIADVGGDGCAVARPLEAVRRALTDQPANAGFRRPHAYLGVVFVGASDDCSFADPAFLDGATDASRCTTRAAALAPVADYAGALTTLVPDPARVILAGALGDGVRLPALLDQFPNRSARVPFTADDLSPILEPFAAFLKNALGLPCFEAPLLDVDPATPGTQHACAAWTEYEVNGEPRGDVLPECATVTTGPCWKVEPFPEGCGDGPALRFERAVFEIPQGVRVIVECLAR